MLFPWREAHYEPDHPVIRLHHLHGAGTWMRYEGIVYKGEGLELMRQQGIFSSWAEGIEGQEDEGQVEPVVLLGDQKESSVAGRPFNETYARLGAAISTADEIVVAGYSFGDLPINKTLREYRQPKARMVVVNTSLGIETRAKEALGMRSWEKTPGWLEIDDRGLPEGLVLERAPEAES